MTDGPVDSLSVAVIGMSGRFPGAGSPEELWRNLRDGVESIRFLDPEELEGSALLPAGEEGFVPAGGMLEGIELLDAPFFGFTPREAALTDPQHRMLLECAWEALERAGYDPGRFPGAVGVFAGSGLNTYFLNNLLPNPQALHTAAQLQIMVGADKDYLAPLISYKLDLRGPSVSVQTACSTSLVAVHLACQGLIDHHCDLALAGGASVRVPQKSGYRYQEGGIYSPDGHCRPFDARAAGTVLGSGAGMVVLKRHQEALEDGDTIHAVIRGTAINNDGAAKVGFTAPSVEGQVAVISEALAAAGVSPEEISLVEAHGTATPLGDPIEVSALHRAFDLEEPRPATCALGSIKSNLGHLDTAAGVAGLIKAVLALEHRTIPPSLHFEAPNPEIDFDAGPFYVPRGAVEWDGGGPRRAGVSSFGIGGTNAHAVLEEAPAPRPGDPSRPWQLLLLSARTPTALDAATENLARHLREHPEIDLADAAHTLQVGRRVFGRRRAIVCRDRGEVLAALAGDAPERVLTLARGSVGRPVVFLFPGQGAQYPGMTRGLYDAEPVYRRALDACAAALQPRLGLDLRRVLFPAPEDAAEAAKRLRRTGLTQPALFSVGYALMRLWEAWGVEPAAVLGHSVGAFAAAVAAGVMERDDALRLVAVRGELMEGLPPGEMLSVRLEEGPLTELLDEVNEDRDPSAAASLAAVNAPGLCTVSGPPETVEEVRRRLADRSVEAKPLHTSHAFHSAMMDPVVERFAEAVAEVTLRPPERRFVSDTTGTWIGDEEATDPGYWGRHLRRPVRFADALGTLLEEPARVFLELGPGRTLTTLVRRHPGRDPEQDAVSCVPPPGEAADDGAGDQPHLLTGLGRLWLAGATVGWEGFYADEHRRRVPLPTYPFERARHWVDAPDAPAAAARAAGAEAPAELPSATPDQAPDQAAEETPAEAGAAPSTGAGGARPEIATAYAEPRDDTERRIAAVWQRALGIGRVGVHDDFFDLGGHSLLATEIGAALRRELGASVALADLFEQPTVAGMAERIRKAEPADDEPAALPTARPDPEHRHQPFPLTDVQQAYWIGRQGGLELGGVGTHIYREIELPAVDLRRLERAFDRVVERQHMLRAVFLPDGTQQILERVPPVEIGVLDLRGLPPAAAAEGVAALRRAMSHQVLPADRWPLFEVRVSVLDGDRMRFHASFDFLIGDAWSFQVLAREIGHFYEQPDAPLPPLEISFREYVLAHRELEESEAFRRSFDYWRGRLETLPPAPDLPLAKSPAELDAPRFTRLAARLPAEAWDRLGERARDAGLTPSGVLLAAFSEVLAVWSKSPRFTLNLTLFNRLPLHPQVGELVGDFTSLTLLAVEHEAEQAFVERARALQDRLWRDLDHRLVSGVRVMRELTRVRGRAAASMPVVFTSTLNMAAPPGEEAGGTEGGEGEDAFGAGDEDGYTISQTPQVWIDHQVAEQAGALAYNWDVVEDLFPPGLLHDLFGAYRDLLERLAADGELWRRTDLDLVPESQLAVRRAVNATGGPIPRGLLQDAFHARAAEDPERPAVITPAETVSYGRLEAAAAALARRLLELGAEPGRLVAVVLPKGWQQVAAVLGVLDAGGAYLPVEPSLPAERRRFLLEDGGVAIALTSRELAGEGAVEGAVEGADGVGEAEGWPAGVRRVAVDDLLRGLEERPPEDAPRSAARPDQLAYVIYTSGSTGRPKGVMIDHRGALNTVADVDRRFRVGPEDRVLGISSLSFDLSVWDLFGLLGAGGTVVLPDPELLREPGHWDELVRSAGVTLWNSVPPLMEMLVGHLEAGGEALPEHLRLVMLSGDWIPVSLPGRIRALAPAEEPQVISLGGATEGSIWSILYPIDDPDPSWASIPYGRPMTNQRFHVLRGDLGPRPDWVPGELAIGGVGVALGYWGDEERTRERFIVHPATGERLYRTGDLGRYRPDGVLEFLGREDFQVKVRGYRIELGEIEAALERHPEVAEAVVVARAESDRVGAQKRLVAYVIPRAAGAAPEPEELRGFLVETLPEYMVPAAFVRLERLPLTANGKVDRKALPEPERPAPASGERSAGPRTEVERALAEMAGELLGGAVPGVEQSLFDLGADSLTAARLVARVRSELGAELPLRAFFDDPTVAGLARRVEVERPEGERPGAIPRVPEGEPVPLSLAQERLWRFERSRPRRPVHNLLHALRLPSGTAPAAVGRALAEVVRRHQTLRTRFRGGGTVPEAVVEPPPDGRRLPMVDLRALPGPRRDRAARAAAARLAGEPFDLVEGPPLRAALALGLDGGGEGGGTGGEPPVLLLVFHHAVVDGWSLGILGRELGLLLQAQRVGEVTSALPEPPLQYGDFARWQRRRLERGELDEALGQWRGALVGAPAGVAWPGRGDVPRDPALRSFRGGTAVRELGEGRTATLQALARGRSVTPFTLLLAAYGLAVGGFAGVDELVVVTPADARRRRELEGLIGYFVNLLPLRLELGPEPGSETGAHPGPEPAGEPGPDARGGASDPHAFDLVLERVRQTVVDAFAHAEAPFEAVVREVRPEAAEEVPPPFTRLVFAMPREGVEPGAGAGGRSAEPPSGAVAPLFTAEVASAADLSLYALGGEGGIVLRLGYDADLFDHDDAARLVDRMVEILDAAAGTNQPGAPAGSAPGELEPVTTGRPEGDRSP